MSEGRSGPQRTNGKDRSRLLWSIGLIGAIGAGLAFVRGEARSLGRREHAQGSSSTLAPQASDARSAPPSAPIQRLERHAARTLQRRGSLRGLVRARSGLPLSEASVCLLRASDEASLEHCVSTDLAGRFVLSDLADTTGLLASARGYRSLQRSIDPTAAPEADIVIELQGGEALAGQVVDATGGPVMGAVVTLRSSSNASSTATVAEHDGRFQLSAAPGMGELCAWADAYSRTCSEVNVPSEGHVLLLAPEAAIVGRVLTRDTKRPVVGASIVATNINGLRVPARATSSATDGSFELGALPPGGYDIVAVSAESRSAQQRVAVGLGETSAPITLWSTPAVPLHGVLLLDGEPCREGHVELSGPVWVRGRALEGGAVRIDGLVPGRYDTTAYCDPAPSQTVSLEVENQPIEQVWSLESLSGAPEPSEARAIEPPSGATITATLDDASQAVVSVFAESQDGVPRRGRERDSTFLFEGLLPGEYRVYVNDYFEQAERVRIARAGERVAVRVKATVPGWIVGRVESDDGSTVADAWVSYFRSDSPTAGTLMAAPTLTDAEGGFKLAAMPGVPYTLMVASAYGDTRVDDIKTAAGVRIRVSLPPTLWGSAESVNGPLP
jgi:hypothetical protein